MMTNDRSDFQETEIMRTLIAMTMDGVDECATVAFGARKRQLPRPEGRSLKERG